VYNFRTIPVVHSRMPLWEGDATKDGGIPHGRAEEDTEQVRLMGADMGEMTFPDDENKMSAHDLGIHLPPPSFWPIVLASGISLTFIGLIFRTMDGPLHWLWLLTIVGLGITTLSIFKFAFEPGHEH
jgi:cytochrome c oxidase subunit 1